MALSKKQQILLDLMKNVQKTMSEHGIEFYLFGGSTIGALRHNGFIPWDDDIDIIIDKENFYKLVDLYSDGPINDVELVYFHNDPYWYRPFAMLVNLNDTCYTRPCLFNRGKALGSRIDVMICDNVPYEKLDEYRDILMLYDDFVTESMLINPALYYQKEEFYALKEREKIIGKPAVELELRKKLESFDGEDADYLVVRYWTKELRYYKKDVVLGPVYHKFEDAMLPIPAKPEEQLRYQFGYSWYIVPREEGRLSHKFYDNCYISGNNYDDDVMRFIDLEEVEPQLDINKRLRIERRGSIDPNRVILSNMVAQRTLMRLDLDENSEYLKQLIHEGDYATYYREMRILTRHRKHFRFVDKEHRDIDDELIHGIMMASILRGMYYQAISIANIFAPEGEYEGSDAMVLLEKTKLLAEAYQDRDCPRIKEALDAFSPQEQQLVPDCILALVRLHMAGEDYDERTADDLISMCDVYMEDYPKNWEVAKVKADLLVEQGRDEEARVIYDDVHEYTRNGLDLYELEEKFDYIPRFGNQEEAEEEEEEEEEDYVGDE